MASAALRTLLAASTAQALRSRDDPGAPDAPNPSAQSSSWPATGRVRSPAAGAASGDDTPPPDMGRDASGRQRLQAQRSRADVKASTTAGLRAPASGGVAGPSAGPTARARRRSNASSTEDVRGGGGGGGGMTARSRVTDGGGTTGGRTRGGGAGGGEVLDGVRRRRLTTLAASGDMQFTPANLRRLFRLLDADNSHEVSPTEIQQGLLALGMSAAADPVVLSRLILDIDEDATGTITEAEFLHYFTGLNRDTLRERLASFADSRMAVRATLFGDGHTAAVWRLPQGRMSAALAELDAHLATPPPAPRRVSKTRTGTSVELSRLGSECAATGTVSDYPPPPPPQQQLQAPASQRAASLPPRTTTLWLDVVGYHEADMQRMCEHYGLSLAAVRDAYTFQAPKLDLSAGVSEAEVDVRAMIVMHTMTLANAGVTRARPMHERVLQAIARHCCSLRCPRRGRCGRGGGGGAGGGGSDSARVASVTVAPRSHEELDALAGITHGAGGGEEDVSDDAHVGASAAVLEKGDAHGAGGWPLCARWQARMLRSSSSVVRKPSLVSKKRITSHAPEVSMQQVALIVVNDRVLITLRAGQHDVPFQQADAAQPPPPSTVLHTLTPSRLSSTDASALVVSAVVDVPSPATTSDLFYVARSAAVTPSAAYLVHDALGTGKQRDADTPQLATAMSAAVAASRSVLARVTGDEPDRAFMHAGVVGQVLATLRRRLLQARHDIDHIVAGGAKQLTVELVDALLQYNFSVRDVLKDWEDELESDIRDVPRSKHTPHLFELEKIGRTYVRSLEPLRDALNPAFWVADMMEEEEEEGGGDGRSTLHDDSDASSGDDADTPLLRISVRAAPEQRQGQPGYGAAGGSGSSPGVRDQWASRLNSGSVSPLQAAHHAAEGATSQLHAAATSSLLPHVGLNEQAVGSDDEEAGVHVPQPKRLSRPDGALALAAARTPLAGSMTIQLPRLSLVSETAGSGAGGDTVCSATAVQLSTQQNGSDPRLSAARMSSGRTPALFASVSSPAESSGGNGSAFGGSPQVAGVVAPGVLRGHRASGTSHHSASVQSPLVSSQGTPFRSALDAVRRANGVIGGFAAASPAGAQELSRRISSGSAVLLPPIDAHAGTTTHALTSSMALNSERRLQQRLSTAEVAGAAFPPSVPGIAEGGAFGTAGGLSPLPAHVVWQPPTAGRFFKAQILEFQELSEDLSAVVADQERQENNIARLRQLLQSLQGDQMNRTLYVLTLLTAITVGPTLLAGIFGMNFEDMPELSPDSGYGYKTFWIALVALVCAMLLVFWRAGFLRMIG